MFCGSHYSLGAQALPYQYASSSSPYGTISGVQPPSSQTRLDCWQNNVHNNLAGLIVYSLCSQLHYQQVPQFIHPHEVSLQGQYMPSFGHGQPHPHEVNLAPVQQPHELTQMQGHAHFGSQVHVHAQYSMQCMYKIKCNSIALLP